jgi:TetR/AcrR family transcriptional repressor of nem operon
MARPREFDVEQALDAAIAVFRDHGYEGASAQMLTDAMGIGRQSLYTAFGDKWQLYCAAVRRFTEAERKAHLEALRSGVRAVDGVAAMLERVVDDAIRPCLGVNSICEFGRSRPGLTKIHEAEGRGLRAAMAERIREGQHENDIAANLDPEIAAQFLLASIAGIRIAARGGADRKTLDGVREIALRSLH